MDVSKLVIHMVEFSSNWSQPGNTVGRVTINGLHATGVYRSALSAESWAAEPITNVVMRDVQAEYAGGGKAWPAGQLVKSPGVVARPLPAWGLYARHVQTLTLEDTRFSLTADDFRPVINVDGVRQLNLDGFKFARVRGVSEPVVTTNIGKLFQNP